MKEKILVVAKTYPNLSQKYDETVCVAGIDSNGNWIRIFPVRYRKLPYDKRFKKFDTIECEIKKTNDKFLRRESHKVEDESIKIAESLSVSDPLNKKQKVENWNKRKKILIKNLDKSLEELEKEKINLHKSIGIIKPKTLVEFYKKKMGDCRDWEKDLILGTQKTLFNEEYKTPLDKIPYWMGYKFFCDDESCTGHDMMCEDWETLELFRKMKDKYKDDEIAFQKVKEKHLEWMNKRDLYFIVGTESRWNKFLIISLFYPPKDTAKEENTE